MSYDEDNLDDHGFGPDEDFTSTDPDPIDENLDDPLDEESDLGFRGDDPFSAY